MTEVTSLPTATGSQLRGLKTHAFSDAPPHADFQVALEDIMAAGAVGYYPEATAQVPKGLKLDTNTALVPGSGGTDGIFTATWSGGNFTVNPRAKFKVRNGRVDWFVVDGPGLCVNASPSAPTVSLSASTGLTGVTIPLAIDVLVPSGETWWGDHASDGDLWQLYRNNAGTAAAMSGRTQPKNVATVLDAAVGEAEAAAAAAQSAADGLSSLYDFVHAVGRPVTPIAGSSVGAGAYIFITASAPAQVIKRFRARGGSAGGNVTLLRGTWNSGTGVFTLTGSLVVTLTANADNAIPITFNRAAGEYLGVYVAGPNILNYTGNTADDLGWLYGATTSVVDTTTTTSQRFEVGFDTSEPVATATAFKAEQAKTTALQTSVSVLAGTEYAYLGDYSPNATGTVSPSNSVWLNDQQTAWEGEWETLAVWSLGTGTQSFAWFAPGTVKDRITATTITVSLVPGLNVLTAGVTAGFSTGIIVPVGSYLGTQGALVAYNGDTKGGPSAIGGQTNWTSCSAGAVPSVFMQMGGRLKRAKSKTILPWRTVLTIGDSLTYTAGRTNYPDLLISRYGMNVINMGRNGDTSTQIMDGLAYTDAIEDGTAVFCVGRNNLGAPSTVRANLATMIGRLPHDRFLVLAVPNGPNEYTGGSAAATYTQIITLNSGFMTDWGADHFYDSRAWLVKYGLQAVGITPTAQDLTDRTNDVVPESLRYAPSDFHYGTNGATALGIKAARELIQRGLLV